MMPESRIPYPRHTTGGKIRLFNIENEKIDFINFIYALA
jgi:hypothetical protein